MDSITHVVLGAVMGEALAGKTLGKRAMVLGAIAQSLPDIDFIASFWLPTADDLLAHRGFTHSFACAALITPFMVWWASRTYKPGLSYGAWGFFLGGQVLLHDLIDSLNAYGIAWFEPFSHERYSFNTLFVADPLFSIWLMIATLALIVLSNQSVYRPSWVKFGLILSSVYLVVALSSKIIVSRNVSTLLDRQQVTHRRYFTTPTPFNSLLYFVVAEDTSGFDTGYRSVFDNDKPLALHHFDRLDSLLEPFRDRPDVQKLLRFSQGYYTVQYWGDTLMFNDLRFGQMAGWSDPAANFVFHYYLQYPEQNQLIVQRGRFKNWNRETQRDLLDKIRGN
jgi:inner membrane protein